MRDLIQAIRSNPFTSAFFIVSMIAVVVIPGCGGDYRSTPVSSSGVHKATAHVQTGSDGLTTEQRNVMDRLKMDNAPGSIKHLYIISAYSGQVIIYSTVRGKVTSSGKRLTPSTVNNTSQGSTMNIPVDIGGSRYETSEVLQDDGTYGSSIEYLYWWDQKGNYHQHYPSGGQIIHISDVPQSVKSVTINMELVDPAKP